MTRGAAGKRAAREWSEPPSLERSGQAVARKGEGGPPAAARLSASTTRSFTTEYPANGSFFRPQSAAPAKAGGVNTHAVCKGLSHAAIRSSRFAVRHVRTREPAKREPAIGVSLEFLMVKLLRAYGECLGARSL